MHALLLCECVYKAADGGPAAAVRALNELASQFGPQLVALQGVQFALPHVAQRFLLAESCDALFCAFMVALSPTYMSGSELRGQAQALSLPGKTVLLS